MDNNTHRPWEGERSQPPSSQPPHSQTLPSISMLTGNISNGSSGKGPLNLSTSTVPRDSGNWSMPPSNGSSGYTSNPMPSLNSAYQPNRSSGGLSQHSPYTPDTAAPSSAGPSPGFSQGQSLPPMNHVDSSMHRGSGDYEDSRRSSVDSRMHQGMERMGLGATSPYASNNASQASIVSGLQRERGIPNGSYRGPRYSSQTSPMSPLGSRSSEVRGFTAGRVAPPILENPRSEVYNAAAPTAGQAYAFPDPTVDSRPGQPPSNYSRRNSFAESFTSSIYTTDSRLPPGQHELPGGTHHHTLSHKQVAEVRGDDPDSPNSTTPYSRTPELRVTHKMAERKRRSEMKDCFEMLRTRLPNSPNNKSSKWETLTKAIEYIQGLENQNAKYRLETEKQRQHIEQLELQAKELTLQLQRTHQSGTYQTPPSAVSQSPSGFEGHYQQNGVPSLHEQARQLPPLMQGIQYSDERR